MGLEKELDAPQVDTGEYELKNEIILGLFWNRVIAERKNENIIEQVGES